MQSELSPEAMLAALAWQVELGADEAIRDAPVNRYEEEAPAAKSGPKREPGPEPAAERSARTVGAPAFAGAPGNDPVAEARAAAASARSLDELAEAMAAYEQCELKQGAKSFVFCDGNPKARVMIVGEAPGREEDQQGKPFVGRAGQLLDRMFAAIGLSRASPDAEHALYITNILPWRPPQNRDPSADELAMMTPFIERHIELADPEIVVSMGRFSLGVLTGLSGITRVRGKWTQAAGRPCLPMLHPAYLLRTPAAKREAWADLLELQARLAGKP
ncbi:MAG: uracil-DNA glycosylase [Paracoccaceae bacterium]|nr:uracil-DNA glycosylase [Paracoccaceae bacterium]